jgi:hypothetical protein
MKTFSQRPVTNACTLIMCNSVENGLPGRDGRDGREGPQGEKGDTGRAGTWGLSWWGRVSIRMITSLHSGCSVMEGLVEVGFFLPGE